MKWARWGSYNLFFEALKSLLLKNAPYVFFWFLPKMSRYSPWTYLSWSHWWSRCIKSQLSPSDYTRGRGVRVYGVRKGVTWRFLWRVVCVGFLESQRFSRAGSRGRAREWATLGVHPLSWLLSNNRLEEVCSTLTKGTFSSWLLLSNQDKGCTPSVAHSLPLPLPPGFCSTCQLGAGSRCGRCVQVVGGCGWGYVEDGGTRGLKWCV